MKERLATSQTSTSPAEERQVAGEEIGDIRWSPADASSYVALTVEGSLLGGKLGSGLSSPPLATGVAAGTWPAGWAVGK